MIDDFEARWGDGSSVLKFKYGHHGTGKGQPCGYKHEQILVFTLDPRMVALPSVKEEEEDKVWTVLQDRLEELLKENDQTTDKSTKAAGAVDAEAQQSSCSAGTSSGARVKKRPKIGLLQARADVDAASARAERELLQFREFAGIQMRTADGGLVTELTDDANTNPLDWWKKWGSKFPNLAQLARRYLDSTWPCQRPVLLSKDFSRWQVWWLQRRETDLTLKLSRYWFSCTKLLINSADQPQARR